jgi:hypothetical protein
MTAATTAVDAPKGFWTFPRILLGAVLVGFAIFLVLDRNEFISIRNGAQVKQENNQVIWGSVRMKIEQLGLTANQFPDQVVKAMVASNESRYGGGGVKGAMLFIREQNPTMPPTLLLKVQQVVEAEFSRFEANQTSLLDYRTAWNNKTEQTPSNITAFVFGYHKGDLDQFTKTITTAEAKQDFANGTMTAPNTFGEKK